MSVKRKGLNSILALMAALKVFAGESWNTWRTVLKVIFGGDLSEAERALFFLLSGRTTVPGVIRELWLIIGRRAGKSFIAGLIAVYMTTCRTWRLAVGEIGVFMIFAADRRQAKVIKNYIAGLLPSLGALADLIENETQDTIVLKNGLQIEIVTSNFRTLRGRTCIGAICDEIAFWQSDDSANPDTEILAALRPAMATQLAAGAMLICLTSPYARRGEVWKAYQKHFGKDDSDVLVLNADTRTFNPDLPQSVIDAAYADDPAHAAAEYGGQFRSDVETFVSPQVVAACRMEGRFELPPSRALEYRAFVDPSGGSSDSMTLAIGHESGGRIVIDVLREQRAPFDPDACVKEFAATLRDYRISWVRGDRYAGEWPRERFQKHGISYRVVDYTKSELYQALLPRLNAGTIELLDDERAIKQLLALERRTSRGGRDSIDHPPSGKDDIANAIAGVANELRAGQHAVARITVDEVESFREHLKRCRDADKERIRRSEQDQYLWEQLRPQPTNWRDQIFGVKRSGAQPKERNWRDRCFFNNR